jgi:hypothetical protein
MTEDATAVDTLATHCEFIDTFSKLSVDEINFLHRQLRIGNVSGKDRDSDLFATIARAASKRTSGDDVRERLEIQASSSIHRFLSDLNYGDTSSNNSTAKLLTEWCEELLAMNNVNDRQKIQGG